ncbi:MAG: hypothetical protein LBM93_01735, partial [Oscillospiraceae bacterium]|nr:hypothetical protein [Oscillospiraceae bacterium]
RLADIQFSKGLTKEEIQAVYNMPSTNENEKLAKSKAIRGLVTYNSENSSNVLEYVMAGYPMGFVIAKDITIRIEASEEESKHASSYLETKSSTSGGILGFRANTSGASTDQSEAAYFGSSDNYFYIRIPGPQILGWFIELTPGDNATPYEKLHSDIYSKKDEQEEVEN